MQAYARRLLFLTVSLVTAGLAAGLTARHAHRGARPRTDPVLRGLVQAPQANETCFSPEEPCDAKLVKFMEGAQKSLAIAIYDINLDQLVHTLIAAAPRLDIRIVVDQRQSKGEHSLVGLLAKAGVKIRYGRQRGIMHNKFVIRDGTMLETGSFNFTNHAASANSENQIYLDGATIVARYQAQFEAIWQRAKPVETLPVTTQRPTWPPIHL